MIAMSENGNSKFLLITLIITCALLVAIGIANLIVDPFQQYHLAAPGKAYYPRTLQRYINPGLAKNAKYDLVVTGSSLMENYDLDEVNRICVSKSINLSNSAMSAYEMKKILEVTFKHNMPKRIVATLDFNSFNAPIDGSFPEIIHSLPLYLYDDNYLNDFHYLFSGKVTMRSGAISYYPSARLGQMDANRAWAWDREYKFSAESMIQGVNPTNINQRFQQKNSNLAHMQASFSKNIFDLIKRHPETEFDFLYSPISILAWVDFYQRDQMNEFLEFKSFVFRKIGYLPNVRIFDFQWDSQITHDLNRYKDIFHYDAEVNRLMMHTVCDDTDLAKKYIVTDNSLMVFSKMLHAQSVGADPVRIVEDVRNNKSIVVPIN